MARTPLGTQPQPRTRTALFAYFAARLAEIRSPDLDEFLERIRLQVRADGVRKAGSAARRRRADQARPGRRSTRPPKALDLGTPRFREWLLIDELAIGLDLHLVRFPGAGSPQHELLQRLAHLSGVRQVFDTATDRTVYAIVITDGPSHRRLVRAALEEVVPAMHWIEILSESSEPAIETWASLARAAAVDERLDQRA